MNIFNELFHLQQAYLKFGLATFPVFCSHMWLVATILNNV